MILVGFNFIQFARGTTRRIVQSIWNNSFLYFITGLLMRGAAYP